MPNSYDEYKMELLQEFLDDHDLVVNLKDGKPADQGDCAWRTGLATICTAIERDHPTTRRFLKALHGCWIDGRPVRHPEWTGPDDKRYSRDQFIPQMAACYYTWTFGNDENKQLAISLLGKFIEVLRNNNWCLNTGWAARVMPPTQFVLREVSEEMGLPHDWKVEGEGIFGPGNLFIGNIALAYVDVEAGGDDPREFYGVHNLFWEILLVYECRNQTNLLKPTTRKLYEACKRHNMALLYWLVGDFDKPREWLNRWPPAWNHISYVWQRNLTSQNETPNLAEQYPRLDYMVLNRLFDLDIRR